MSGPAGILNVKEDIQYNGTKYCGAVGDGVADDTDAILNHLAAFDQNVNPDRRDYAGLYFPAGAYRITRAIDVPWLVNVRLFGDGGRGGHLDAAGVPSAR